MNKCKEKVDVIINIDLRKQFKSFDLRKIRSISLFK